MRQLPKWVALLAVFLCSAAKAQQPVPGPTLLRRLAAAVDGHPTGKNVFVVARYDGDNAVAGVLEDRKAADALARTSGANYGVFGPYTSQVPYPYDLECHHEGPSNMTPPLPVRAAPSREDIGRMLAAARSNTATANKKVGSICVDTTRGPGQHVVRRDLIITYSDNTIRVSPIDPPVDAIFFTASAIDKSSCRITRQSSAANAPTACGRPCSDPVGVDFSCAGSARETSDRPRVT
jgi:hypothetical protein